MKTPSPPEIQQARTVVRAHDRRAGWGIAFTLAATVGLAAATAVGLPEVSTLAIGSVFLSGAFTFAAVQTWHHAAAQEARQLVRGWDQRRQVSELAPKEPPTTPSDSRWLPAYQLLVRVRALEPNNERVLMLADELEARLRDGLVDLDALSAAGAADPSPPGAQAKRSEAQEAREERVVALLSAAGELHAQLSLLDSAQPDPVLEAVQDQLLRIGAQKEVTEQTSERATRPRRKPTAT